MEERSRALVHPSPPPKLFSDEHIAGGCSLGKKTHNLKDCCFKKNVTAATSSATVVDKCHQQPHQVGEDSIVRELT